MVPFRLSISLFLIFNLFFNLLLLSSYLVSPLITTRNIHNILLEEVDLWYELEPNLLDNLTDNLVLDK